MGGAKNAEELFLELEADGKLERAFGEDDSEPISDEDRFRTKLSETTTLSPAKIELLVARLVNGLTFKEIAVALGYANKHSANKQFRDALAMLRRNSNGKS